MTASRIITEADIGGFVRAGDLPLGAVFVHHSDIDCKLSVTDHTPEGVVGQFGARKRLFTPSRFVRLISFPGTEREAVAGCSVHGLAHDDTDEHDCGAPSLADADAEALKAMVLQYGVHSIEFGATGTAWGSLSSRIRTGLAGEIDDAIDAVFAERDEWKKRAESLLRDVEEYTRLRDAQEKS